MGIYATAETITRVSIVPFIILQQLRRQRIVWMVLGIVILMLDQAIAHTDNITPSSVHSHVAYAVAHLIQVIQTSLYSLISNYLII